MQLANELGAAHLELTEFDRAAECFTRSREKAELVHHALGTQSALEWLGKTDVARADYPGAAVWFQKSWDVLAAANTQIPAEQQDRADALLHLNRSRSAGSAGDFALARLDADFAVVFFDAQPGETDNRAKSHQARGRALLGLGDATGAIADLEHARALFVEEGLKRHQAVTGALLGDAYRAAGLPDRAETAYRTALDIFISFGDKRSIPTTEALRRLNP
jgi:tetratricopeptide (TPR) repeat protein